MQFAFSAIRHTFNVSIHREGWLLFIHLRVTRR